MHLHSQISRREITALLMGGVLILLVSGYYIGRNFLMDPNPDNAYYFPTPTSDSSDTINTILPATLKQKLLTDVPLALIDIRSIDAYQSEHIPGSLSVPISTLGNFSPEKDQVVVVIAPDNDPQTTEIAHNILNKKSFPFVFLKGGFESWKKDSNQVISYGDPNSFIDQSKVSYISISDLNILLASEPKPFILDVQSYENYQKKHVKGAINIPIEQLEKRVREIPPARQVVVYGENEFVSFRAGVRLSDLNVFMVKTLSGNAHLSSGSNLSLEP